MRYRTTRLFAGVLASFLLLAGAGCGPARPKVEQGSRAMMPQGVPMMEGLEPLEESSWRVTVDAKGERRLESHWTTTALFDKVEAWYVDAFGKQGFTTHTVTNGTGVTIYWGEDASAVAIGSGSAQFIRASKEQAEGRTRVDMVLDLRTP